LYVREAFGAEPDVWQAEALTALGSPAPIDRRISMQACAGPGKSCVLAWAAWWFLHTQGDLEEHPTGLATSITADNLRDNLWKEIARWHGRSKIVQRDFQWTPGGIYARAHPATWCISPRSFPKSADTEEQGRTLSGLHAPYILYLIDESGDISPAVLRSAEQGLTNCKWGKILQAGNPTSLEGMLHEAATRQRHMWHVIRITGDPDDPKRSPRVDAENARTQIGLYGRDNAWVKSYILGEFPPASINTLLGPDEVEAAMARGCKAEDIAHAQRRMGVDVARFGDDATVIFCRQGLLAHPPEEMRNARSEEIAARVAVRKIEFKSEVEFIDATGGWGAGAIDALLQAGHAAIPVNYSGRPNDPRYFNKRSEMWFEMRDWVRRGGCLPRDPQLARELTTPTYTFSGGKFRLEEKDQIKKRLGFSPDKADALAQTFALPEMPAATAPGLPGRPAAGRVVSEWDPFEDRPEGQVPRGLLMGGP
jgi:hypothetical protein